MAVRKIRQRAFAPTGTESGARVVYKDREGVERSGVVWSLAPAARTVWAMPDGTDTPVLVHLGKGREVGWAGECRFDRDDWRRRMAMADHVRRFARVYGVRSPAADHQIGKVTWHVDPACPVADPQGTPYVPDAPYIGGRRTEPATATVTGLVMKLIYDRVPYDCWAPASTHWCTHCIGLEG